MVKKKKILEKLDILADVKNWRDFPWPFGDKSVSEITVGGVLEYVPGKLRGKFMDEVYRIMADDGKATVTVPYWNSAKGIQDYRYEWPPLCEQAFLYFNKGWRELNKLDLNLTCNFDFTYGYACEPETAARSDDTRSFNLKHYTNCVDALVVNLTKATPSP